MKTSKKPPQKIIKIEINPSGKMADIDQSNNKIDLN